MTPKQQSSSTPPPSATNPWFGLSMVLVGLIAGYGIAIATGGDFLQQPASGNQPTAKQPANNDEQPSPQPEPSQDMDALIPFDPDEDHYRGNPDADIVMIEYSDYECPFCTRHHPTMQQVVDEFGDDVVWVYRHYPLSFHQNAMPSAVASECVAELAGNDAFWEFTDLVFEEGSEVSKHAGYAEQIGLDADAFQECVDNDNYSDEINQEMASGTDAGVRGTPGTFIYNANTEEMEYISGAQPYSNIKSAIEALQ